MCITNSDDIKFDALSLAQGVHFLFRITIISSQANDSSKRLKPKGNNDLPMRSSGNNGK